MVAFTFTYPYVFDNLQEGGNFESLRAALVTAFGVAGTGTVTTVSVVTANGLAGTVANATTTPAITLTTSITGLLKGNGTAISAATAGTDYVAPGGAGSNKYLQMVSVETGAVATGTTTIPYDDTIPQNTEGDQYMSLAITPVSATSKLIIDVVFVGTSAAAGTNGMTAALFQDATANALAAVVGPAFPNVNIPIVFRHVMTSGTTSATTFKVRGGSNAAGTTTFNGQLGGRIYGGVMASSIVIQEVLP